jgi:hypothetical protein
MDSYPKSQQARRTNKVIREHNRKNGDYQLQIKPSGGEKYGGEILSTLL